MSTSTFALRYQYDLYLKYSPPWNAFIMKVHWKQFHLLFVDACLWLKNALEHDLRSYFFENKILLHYYLSVEILSLSMYVYHFMNKARLFPEKDLVYKFDVNHVILTHLMLMLL